MSRTLFGHPIREETTAAFFPEKMTLDQFERALSDAPQGFATNMRQLGDRAIEPRYVEEWTETFLAWCEIEEEWPRPAAPGQRTRGEWLDLLHRCQDGTASCLYVLKQMEAEQHTPNPNLPPLGDGPRCKLLVEVDVPVDWEKRLDMQWVLEREIHADRWEWKWADKPDPFVP